MIRTVSITVPVKAEEYLPLLKEASAIFNQHVEWAFTEGTYNKNKAHHALYRTIREEYPEFPSALIQCVRDTAMEAIKRDKFRHRPSKKETSGIRLNKLLISVKGAWVSLVHPGKRFRFKASFPDFFREVIENGEFRSATLCYLKKGNRIVLNLSYQLNNPESSKGSKVLGVDRGIYNLASTSDGKHYSGSEVRAQQRKHLYKKRQLQAKGTKSAKRKLKKISGRYARFSKDVNHCISKSIVSEEGLKTIVLEDLKGIRSQRRGKKLNKWLSSWSFYQLQTFLKYKAEALGISVDYVDARYTSQKCSSCGYTSKDNRNKHSFTCISCGHSENADTNAAKNIKQNYLISLLDKEQAAVNQPNVSQDLL